MSTITDLTNELNSLLADNTSRQITPAKMRTLLVDLITRLEADAIAGGGGTSGPTPTGTPSSATALYGDNSWKEPTVDTSHITATGTASSTTALYGDNTWKTVTSGSTSITGGGLGFSFDSRAAAISASIATTGAGGPNWIRTNGYASAGDGGGWLYVRTSGTPNYSNLIWFSSADGQKWVPVIKNDPLKLEMAGGGVSATASANSAAVAAIHSIFVLNKSSYPSGYTFAGPNIQLGYGQYNFNGPWYVQGSSNIRGLGSGSAGGRVTLLKFPSGDGMILGCPSSNGRLYNTSYGTDYDSRGTVIRDLAIQGGWVLNGATPYSQNNSTGERGIGILTKGTCLLENLYISGFAEFGVYIKGTAGATGSSAEPTPGTADNTDSSESYVCGTGYTNTFTFTRVYVEDIGCDGFRARGADANAGTYIGCSADQCYAWGFNDLSFLGNQFFGCHSATNGFRWAEQSRLDTNTGKMPGAYQAADDSSTTNFISCYSEGGQPGSALRGYSIIVGGLHAAGSPTQTGSGTRIFNGGGGGWYIDPFRTTTLGGDVSFGSANVDGEIWNFNGQIFHRNQANRYEMGTFGQANSFAMTLDSYTPTMGRSAAIGGGWPQFARGLFLGGPGQNEGFDLRCIAVLDAVPTTGNWAQGDRVYIKSPSAGGAHEYVCTAGGTPGTWKSVGNLAA